MSNAIARSRPGFRIRAARAVDLDGLLVLEHRCFAGDRLSRRALLRHLQSDSAALLVAERGGAVVGSALVLFRRDSPAARLYSIAVDGAARGLGLGAALLGASERRARARGASALRLEVNPANRAAVRLYERHGYLPFARVEGYYEDGAPAVRLRRSLRR